MTSHDPSASVPDGPAPAARGRRSPKNRDRHLDRLAVVYIRQSSPQQVLDHKASRQRQYELVDHALARGWPADQVLVIDDDQGRSAKEPDRRHGFQRLLAEVTMGHVGLVLGLEMSRLSRTSRDWHHLLEVCAVFGTLLADQDGVYDANDVNDRLLLGLKGTISEFELVTMRNRLDRGRLHKAERGELFSKVPCGYVKLPSGEVALDPDERAPARPVDLAAPRAGDAQPDAAQPDLRRGLCLRTSPGRADGEGRGPTRSRAAVAA